jgi:hydroxymethylpyrimidine/phosphomethylpyrimidine kinase
MLARVEIATFADAIDGAQALAQIAQVAVLIKGGHLVDGPDSVDVLVHTGGVEQLRAPRVAGPDVHGTGCALSSAIAAHLALGATLVDACRTAKAFVAERITTPVYPGRGAPAVL